MGKYLRDKMISFLTISSKEINEINYDLTKIVEEINKNGGNSSLNYILRYDGLGVSSNEYKIIKDSLDIAKKIERVIFQIVSTQNNTGTETIIGIRLEAQNMTECSFFVTDDNEKWVDSVFGKLSSRLDKYKNLNWLPHTPIAELIFQLAGVLAIFFICLIVAYTLSPQLNFPNAFFIIFIGIFLLLSNMWTYILILMGKFRNTLWPSISFNKKPIGWFGQMIITFLITSLLSGLVAYCLKILSGISFVILN